MVQIKNNSLVSEPIMTILNTDYLLLAIKKFFGNFSVIGKSLNTIQSKKKKMLTFLNRGCVFAIKNTGQYTSGGKLNQMSVIGPQNVAFAQNRYFKHMMLVYWFVG